MESAENQSEQQFRQLKKERVDALSGPKEHAPRMLFEALMKGAEPLLVTSEDVKLQGSAILQRKRDLMRVYQPLINSVLDNDFTSQKLVEARINVDWAEQDLANFRESDEGRLGQEHYDDSSLAQMEGTVSSAKNFLKTAVLLRADIWKNRGAYRKKLEVWASALMEYQHWVYMAQKGTEGRSRVQGAYASESDDAPRRASNDDIVTDGILGLGPLGESLGPDQGIF